MKLIIKISMLIGLVFFSNNLEAQLLKNIKKKVQEIEKKISKEQQPPQRQTRTQPPKKKLEPEIEFEKGISFVAPNEDFIGFELQQFRGKIRFGQLNGHNYINPHLGKSSASQKTQVRRKMKDLSFEYGKYHQLLRTKYLSNFYDLMNKEMPHQVERSTSGSGYYAGDENDRSSYIAQENMIGLAYTMISPEGFIEFLGDSDKARNIAKMKHRRFSSANRYSIHWKGKDEFEIIETYQKFVERYCKDLRKWAAQLDEEGYFVEQVRFEKYDFQNSGFSIRFSPPGVKNVSESDRKYVYEPKQQRQKPFTHLYKMDTTDAKAMIDRKNERKLGRSLYAVYKVKYYGIEDPSVLSTYRQPFLLQHVTSPIIEIFEDEALTKKLGEVTMK